MALYSIVFGLLIAELVVVAALICPLPNVLRKAIVGFLGRLAKNPTIKTVFWVVTSLLFLMFAESVKQVQEKRMERDGHSRGGGGGGASDIIVDKASRFRSERNLYMTGMALVLIMLIARTLSIVNQWLQAVKDKDTMEAKFGALERQLVANKRGEEMLKKAQEAVEEEERNKRQQQQQQQEEEEGEEKKKQEAREPVAADVDDRTSGGEEVGGLRQRKNDSKKSK